MKRWILAVLIALALAAVVVIAGLNQMKLDALQEPGEVETFLATAVKQYLPASKAYFSVPPSLAPASVTKQFRRTMAGTGRQGE